MRRRKFRSARTSGRSFFRRRSRRASRSSGSTGRIIQPTAMAYGAVRGYAAGYIAPQIAKMLPANLQQYADELGMGVAAWAAAKYGSGIIKQIGMNGLTVENARIGEQLSQGLIPQTTSSTNPYMYG